MKPLAALAALVFCATSAFGQEPEPLAIEVPEYADRLDAVAAALERGDGPAARAGAAALSAHVVEYGDERLSPDRALLAEVQGVGAVRLPTLSRRLRLLASSVRQAGGGAPAPPDHALVAELREADRIAAGGVVGDPAVAPLSVPERITSALTAAAEWIADRLRDLWRWLRKLWPRAPAEGGAGSGAVSVTLVVVALVVIVLSVLAVHTIRRSPPPSLDAAAAPAPGHADDDPLSRQANEWEAYARELAAAGRRREAVRAWYHAVLSSLFRAGLLEPRKGRTNWEHVARLSPQIRWRAEFVRMTRDFEREWYGRDESSLEALRECQTVARGLLQALHEGAA